MTVVDTRWKLDTEEHKPMMDEAMSRMMLYAVRYSLSSNGTATAKEVMDFLKPLLPYLHKSVLYTMQKDIIFNWQQHYYIGQSVVYDDDWTEFCVAIREERRKRGAVM